MDNPNSHDTSQKVCDLLGLHPNTPIKQRKDFFMRKRNIQVLFRVDKDEMQDLKKKVKKSGLSQETFIRQVVAGNILREKPDKEFYDAMRELSAIGNRINQLAAKANALNFIDAPMVYDEAKKWAKFQTQIQQHFLLPEKKT